MTARESLQLHSSNENAAFLVGSSSASSSLQLQIHDQYVRRRFSFLSFFFNLFKFFLFSYLIWKFDCEGGGGEWYNSTEYIETGGSSHRNKL